MTAYYSSHLYKLVMIARGIRVKVKVVRLKCMTGSTMQLPKAAQSRGSGACPQEILKISSFKDAI